MKTVIEEKKEYFEMWKIPFNLKPKTDEMDLDHEQSASILKQYIINVTKDITKICLEKVAHVPLEERISWDIELKKQNSS